MNVLVVEDDETIVQIVAERLSEIGHNVTVAPTLAAAFDAWKDARPSSSHGPRPFRVILCDYELPEYEIGGMATGKGTEFLSKVLADTALDDEPPEVILFSGRDREREVETELPGQAHRVTLFTKSYLPEVLDYIMSIGG